MAEATLADLSLGIKKTNDTLAETLSAQKKLNALIIKQNKSTFAGDDLESQREKNKSQAEAETIRESKSGGGVSDSGPGFLSGLGIGRGLAGAGGALALASALGMKGLRTALIVSLADEVGNAVTEYTKNPEAGAAVERGMVAGGFGLLLGKKFGVIAGIVGAALTDENQEKLAKLGKSLEPHKQKLAQALDEFGMKLPTVDGILSGITSTFGGAITGLTKLAEGDYAGLKENLSDIALTAAGLTFLIKPGGSLSLAMKALKAPFVAASTALKGTVAAGASAAAASRAAKSSNLSKAGSINPDTGKIVGVDGKDTVVSKDAKDAKKLQKEIRQKAAKMKAPKIPVPPRLGTFMKMLKAGGPLSALLGIADVSMILASEGSIDDKIGELGGALGSAIGGLGGFAAGGAAGALLTGPLAPFGAIGGGILGGIAGTFGGDAIGMALAQYLFGKKVTAFGFPFGWVNDKINGATDAAPSATESAAMGPDLTSTNTPKGVDGGLAAAASSQATMSRPARSTPIQSGGAMGEFGGGSTVIAPTITNNTGQSTTVITPPTPSANNSEDPVREMSGMAFVL